MESDAEIVRQVLDGDANAYERLLRRHAPRVFEAVGRRVPAADVPAVAQDVFLAAYRSLGAYGQRNPFDHWLLRIARRRCCDYWRARGRREGRFAESLDADERAELDRVMAATAREQQRESEAREESISLVQKALASLDAEDRAMMEAVYFEEAPLKDVAAGFGWSLAKTKMRALRARRALRGILEQWRRGGKESA
ncbi:MAG TPA: RNA polymerase sigma factor [Kiritimatiellia bacterium]|nr:RNA polymerase sigma factor [Kiritimatiellia bacterium]HSA17369.1 RNA polymerase sigma factor [Kiritimatiellia bacterium]